MSSNISSNLKSSQKKFLLALHSSSEELGVGLIDCVNYPESPKYKIFDLGRRLSNDLMTCVEDMLPAKYWKYIARLSVAKGPGGFTGTRLTVVMARTLAQQLNCQLDGISSFALMAPRLSKELSKDQLEDPFWIITNLKRRGIVGGCYQLNKKISNSGVRSFLELKTPHLLPSDLEATPAINAKDDVRNDIMELLKFAEYADKRNIQSTWENVLPIYPTSPVG